MDQTKTIKGMDVLMIGPLHVHLKTTLCPDFINPNNVSFKIHTEMYL